MKKIFLIFLLPLSQTAFAVNEPLLHQSDISYVGSFRMPAGKLGSNNGFDYTIKGIAYNPANDSLFISGSIFEQKVAEISIPSPVNSVNPALLPRAAALQNFQDITEGNLTNIGAGGASCCANGDQVGGLFVHSNRLIGNVYSFYDAGHEAKLSHFTSGLNLSVQGDFGGMYQVGSINPAFVAGYMASIPPEWQASLGGPALTGQCCLSIIGRTSEGPAASVFDPDDLGVRTPVPATPVVYYDINHHNLGNWDNKSISNPVYNMGTAIQGLVFPEGTSSVLFFGRTGLGIPCYGEGTNNPALDQLPVPGQGDIYCYDPLDNTKGTHAYPYTQYVWAYDVNDLISVKNGQKNPWDIYPYDTWAFKYPTVPDSINIMGAAYDPVTQRIFIAQNHGDPAVYDPPIIHVYHVNAAGGIQTNQAPWAYAGMDLSVDVSSTVSLKGIATDDNLPSPHALSYSWSRVSGSGTVTFTNGARLNASADFSASGSYVLRLTVSDGSLSATDDISVTVTGTPLNGNNSGNNGGNSGNSGGTTTVTVNPPIFRKGNIAVAVDSGTGKADMAEIPSDATRKTALLRKNLTLLGSEVEFTMSSGTLASATIYVPFDASLIPAGYTTANVRVAYYNPSTGLWEIQDNVTVQGAQLLCTVPHFSIYAPVLVKPVSAPELQEIYVFPNPTVGSDNPTIRVKMGQVDTVEVDIYDLSGAKVHSASFSGDSPQIGSDAQFYYDYAWTEEKASGVYIAAVKGKTASSTVKAKVKFAVIR